jgi:DNA-binding FadR family transcriptional regulator
MKLLTIELGTVAEIIAVTISEHESIYDALRACSVEGVRNAMSHHVRNSAARLRIEILVDHRS